VEVELHAFLTSALDGGEIAPGTYWIGSCVGPRAGLDAVANRKISSPCCNPNPGRPARSPITTLGVR